MTRLHTSIQGRRARMGNALLHLIGAGDIRCIACQLAQPPFLDLCLHQSWRPFPSQPSSSSWPHQLRDDGWTVADGDGCKAEGLKRPSCLLARPWPNRAAKILAPAAMLPVVLTAWKYRGPSSYVMIGNVRVPRQCHLPLLGRSCQTKPAARLMQLLRLSRCPFRLSDMFKADEAHHCHFEDENIGLRGSPEDHRPPAARSSSFAAHHFLCEGDRPEITTPHRLGRYFFMFLQSSHFNLSLPPSRNLRSWLHSTAKFHGF